MRYGKPFTKEPCTSAKEPYISATEPYTSAKEPHISVSGLVYGIWGSLAEIRGVHISL